MYYILDLEHFKLYEVTSRRIIAAPKGVLFHCRYYAIKAFKDYLKSIAETLEPSLIKIGPVDEICLINGKPYNVYLSSVNLNGSEEIVQYRRWIDYHRDIIWKNQDKNGDSPLVLEYIKL